jgi:activator of HSP90 ATPase
MMNEEMNTGTWQTRSLSSRRDFSVRLVSFLPGLAIVGGAFGASGTAETRAAAGGEEISRSAEAIHQEVVFKASTKRLYEVLTDARQFEKVVQLSAAVQTKMVPPGKPAEISREAGGAFSLFGGYVTGRHIELVPNTRLVQAWRPGSWDAGIYSIARFELKEEGSGTKLVFDHTGFPRGDAEHLLEGWNGNYWEPLKNVLG